MALALAWVLQTLSWLLPNHYFPWTSFWQDATTAAAFALPAAVAAWHAPALPRVSPLVGLAGLLALVPLLQWAGGLIHFGGDALTASLYLLGLMLALAWPALSQKEPAVRTLLGWLAWAALVAALISVGLALCQWLQLDHLGVLLTDLRPGERPYANLAQPNQLATLLLLGLVAAGALHQHGRLSTAVLGLIAAWLGFGVVMTGSRTGGLALALLLAWLFAQHARASLRLPRPALPAFGAYVAAWVLAWPVLSEALGLSAGRTLAAAAQVASEGRWQFWRALLDAVARAPWTGYGWNQVAVAQVRVAADHPFVGQQIEHSHNLALDLLVWNGVPLGGVVIAVLAGWGWRHARACRDATVAWLLAGIGAVFVHAMLEFPLEYAYFLLPLGLMMGAADRLAPVGRTVVLPRSLVCALMAVAVTLTAWGAADYLRTEERHRQMRFELAGFIGATAAAHDDGPVLLTQWRAFEDFARTRARPGMTSAELNAMRRVAERFAYPPALLRHALALALNGRPQEAARVLVTLCHIHRREHCDEGRAVWRDLARGAYPELAAVPYPPPQEPAR